MDFRCECLYSDWIYCCEAVFPCYCDSFISTLYSKQNHKMLAVDLMEQIEEQLPSAIDHIIRISSKYGDMKSIIYETARSCDNPLREILETSLVK